MTAGTFGTRFESRVVTPQSHSTENRGRYRAKKESFQPAHGLPEIEGPARRVIEAKSLSFTVLTMTPVKGNIL